MWGCGVMPGAEMRLGKVVVSKQCPVLHQLLPASPPKHMLPPASHPSPALPATQGTWQCHWLLHTPGSPAADPSSAITAWGHPAMDQCHDAVGPQGCLLVAARFEQSTQPRQDPPGSLGSALDGAKPLAVSRVGLWEHHPGTVWRSVASGQCSPGCRPSGPSPPRPPTPGKRSGVSCGERPGPEKQKHPIATSPWDESVPRGQAQGQVANVLPVSGLPVPSLSALPAPTPPGHRELKC